MSQDDDVQREKFSLATHLYARLRRSLGRSIDVVWLLKDETYQREILDLAVASTDEQTRLFASRFAELIRTDRKPRPAAIAPRPATQSVSEPASVAGSTKVTPLNRYVGSLR